MLKQFGQLKVCLVCKIFKVCKEANCHDKLEISVALHK